jgi:flagellar protein FliS
MTSNEAPVNTQAALSSYTNVRNRGAAEEASPHKLVDMLFEGALQRIVEAKGAMQFGNVELKGKKINRAVSIVGGLRESLNTDQGGEIAQNLDALYVYIQNILYSAHAKNDAAKLDEATTLLLELRGAWRQIG